MKKLKRFSMLVLSAIVVLVLVACGGADTDGDSSVESRIIRMAHTQSVTHPVHLSLEEFARLVEEKTNGEIEVEIHANGVLGDERDYVESLQQGTLDMAKLSVNSLENFDDVWGLFAIPYAFEDLEHGAEFMNSENVDPLYESMVDEYDIRAITWYDAGARNYYTSDTAIRTPEDMQGLTMRVQSSQIQIATAEALGGSATPVDFSELYTAIQSGVVDGADNGIVAFNENNLGEVAKYFSFTEHVLSPDVLIIKDSLFQELTEDQRVAIQEAGVESTAFHDESWQDAREEAIKTVEEQGVEVIYPDLEAFQNALAPLRDELLEENQEIAEYYEVIQSMR